MTTNARLVLIACPATQADALASALVEARVAACVSLVPGLRSVYHWQGAVERAEETLLLAKTTAAAYPALETLVRARHPYELPEVIAVKVEAGLPAYLQWLADETTPDTRA
jgi:periplasmic divalent cation tolerance protein